MRTGTVARAAVLLRSSRRVRWHMTAGTARDGYI
jgi:hypothetical protein